MRKYQVAAPGWAGDGNVIQLISFSAEDLQASDNRRGDMMRDRTPFTQEPEMRSSAIADVEMDLPFPFGSNRSPSSADGRVGRRIKDARLEQGLTQKRVAALVGVTGGQIHRYEMGASRVATSRLMAIATVLGVSPERLMSDAAPTTGAMEPACGAAVSGDLVELVELYSSLTDRRRRSALIAFARSMAAQPLSAPPGGHATP